MVEQKMKGVVAPILTPFNNDLSFNGELYAAHCRWLLEQGVHYISPFGTTGEALSMSVDERMAAVDYLIDNGIDPGKLMPGAGLCNIDDSGKLCVHAAARGCAAVMTLPPFFFKNASDDGLYNYFVRLIDSVDHPRLRICLYHIPPMAGIGFTAELTARLADDYPDIVIAYKDSSGDFENTRSVIKAAPNISVFPGTETFLYPGLEAGAAGCISATCNVNPAGIREVFDMAAGGAEGDIDRALDNMIGIRKLMEKYSPIPAMKGLLSIKRNDERWRNIRPPLLPGTRAETASLIAELDGRLENL